ncbi:MAG: hypothetical protein EOM11_09730, partial [Erysipelotrichia bacterium]|nr:hypothetical protein [Erysipelotrichia bacterium]
MIVKKTTKTTKQINKTKTKGDNMSLFSRESAVKNATVSSFNDAYLVSFPRIELKNAVGTLADGSKIIVGQSLEIDVKLPNNNTYTLDKLSLWYRSKDGDSYGDRTMANGEGLFSEILFTAVDMGFDPSLIMDENDCLVGEELPYTFKEWDNAKGEMIDVVKDIVQLQPLVDFINSHKIGIVFVKRNKYKSIAVNAYDLSLYNSIKEAFDDVESVWLDDFNNDERKYYYEIKAVYDPTQDNMTFAEKKNGIDKNRG